MDADRRKRRRKRRINASLLFLGLALCLAWFFESQDTTTVVIVRYAEIQQDGTENPGLSPAGHARAQELARVVKSIGVIHGVDAIFATEYRSTQQTAEPLSEMLHVPMQVVTSANFKGLRDLVLKEYRGKIVLIITIPQVVPSLVKKFHGSKNVAPIAEDEYDRLYIVSIPWYGKEKTLQLKYGSPYISQ